MSASKLIGMALDEMVRRRVPPADRHTLMLDLTGRSVWRDLERQADCCVGDEQLKQQVRRLMDELSIGETHG
jgi:hypothetical protein